MATPARPEATYGSGFTLYVSTLAAMLLLMPLSGSLAMFLWPIPAALTLGLFLWRWPWAVAGIVTAIIVASAVGAFIILRAEGAFGRWVTSHDAEVWLPVALAVLAALVVAYIVRNGVRSRGRHLHVGGPANG